jgi:hypothetical protein
METTPTPVLRNKVSRVSLIAGVISLICFLGLLYAIVAQVPDTLGYGGGNVGLEVTFYILLFSPVILGIIGIAAGIVSLVQIKKSREAGKDSAIVIFS